MYTKWWMVFSIMIITVAPVFSAKDSGDDVHDTKKISSRYPTTITIRTTIFDQNLEFALPETWEFKKPAFLEQTPSHRISEYLPQGQQIETWRDMFTVQGFKGLATKRNDAHTFLIQTLAEEMKSACGENYCLATVSEENISGYPAVMAIIGGPNVPTDQASSSNKKRENETGLYLAIKGPEDVYLLHRTWENPVKDGEMNQWKDILSKTKLIVTDPKRDMAYKAEAKKWDDFVEKVNNQDDTSDDARTQELLQKYLKENTIKDDMSDEDIARKEYYETGELKNTIALYDEKKYNIVKAWYKNGELQAKIFLKNDKKCGPAFKYYENGQLQEKTYYKNDKMDGESLEYYPDGTLKDKGYFKDGKKEGLIQSFYNNGKMQGQVECKQDKPEGVLEEFYPNGQLKIKGYFKNGKPDKEYVEYYETGTMKLTGKYKDNKKEGTVRTFFPNGKIQLEVEYKQGKVVGAKEYYESGVIKTDVHSKKPTKAKP